MYLDGKRIAMIVATLVMAGIVMWMLDARDANLEDQMAIMEGDIAPSEVKAAGGEVAFNAKLLADMEAFRQAVQIRLEADDITGAKAAYQSHFPEIDRRMYAQGHKLIEPTGTETFYDRHQAIIASQGEAMTQAMDRLLDRLATGEGDPQQVKDLLHGFHGTHRQVRERYDARWRDVEAARRSIVADWCRVRFWGEARYTDAIREAVLERIHLPPGKRLVVDRAFTSNEANWTWLQVSIGCVESSEYYTSSGGAVASNVSGSASIPSQVTVKIEVKPGTRPRARTSWDKVPPLDLFYDTPDSVFARLGEGERASFEDLQEEARQELEKQVVQIASSIPVFSVEPPEVASQGDPR